ncbi:MAG: hypothetical protein IJM92_19375 [Fibrobacter sp.]|uniref:hypothetical protein n=1 Tax=Fibrobacter sp. TaxID=35828 RepID=UPI0025B8DB31|nr:hypothetical protein [Fibrobacter sp.]MBQ7081777.1 hypothetical protein [Fibrobacter sp.]
MIKRAWTYGLATLVLCNVACDSGRTAGSSMETENSIALLTQLADGTPAARMDVIVRPESYLSGATELGSDSLYQLHFETDEQGRVVLSDVPTGSYVIEARNDSLNLKGFVKIAYVESDSTTPLTVEVSEPTKVSGRVGLPQLVRRAATVSVQGLDYQVPMDSTGYFEFDALPSGNVEIVAFVNDTGADSVTEYGRIEADVGAGVGDGLYLGDSAYVKKYFVFDDFENGVGLWEPNASENAKVSLIKADAAGKGREGLAVHFVCKRDSAAKDWDWALIGRELGGFVDMSNLDSIAFWARSTEKSKIMFAFDVFVNDDSVLSAENVKAQGYYEVDTVWTRFTVIPSKLDTADSNGGNVGWDAVKNRVTKISIFGQMGTEVWIDDIEVFGYGIFDPYAPIAKKKD